MLVYMSNCTYLQTGQNFRKQKWATCYDCFKDHREGSCIHCLYTCHKGHNIGPIRESNFFCDCGDRDLCFVIRNLKRIYGEDTQTVQARRELPAYTRLNTKSKRRLLGKRHQDARLSRLRRGQPVSAEEPNMFTKWNNDFNEVISKRSSDEIVYSPLSITLAMLTAYLGARGTTKDQMREVFQLPNNNETVFNEMVETKTSLPVRMGNAIFVDQNFSLHKVYKAIANKLGKIEPADFSKSDNTCLKINNWINNMTNGMISNLIEPSMLDKTTRLLIVNAIYFKADWNKKFQKYLTENLPFYTPNGNKLIPMMKQTNKFMYAEDSDNQVLEMLYQDGKFVMGVVLPKSLDDNPTIPSSNKLDEYRGNMMETEVFVQFPRFQQRDKFSLTRMFKELGMTDAFDEFRADFSGMFIKKYNEGLYIADIIHEAVVIVDEEGTEASAATAIITNDLSMPRDKPEPIEFNANHPFAYYIRHIPTNTIIFSGRKY